MTTLTLTRGQISPIIEIGKGTRVTSSGNGTIEYYPGSLANAKNGGTFETWPKGIAAGSVDAIRGMCIRATATGAMVVTLEEGKNDFSADGAYWDSEYATFYTDANNNTVGVSGADGSLIYSRLRKDNYKGSLGNLLDNYATAYSGNGDGSTWPTVLSGGTATAPTAGVPYITLTSGPTATNYGQQNHRAIAAPITGMAATDGMFVDVEFPSGTNANDALQVGFSSDNFAAKSILASLTLTRYHQGRHLLFIKGSEFTSGNGEVITAAMNYMHFRYTCGTTGANRTAIIRGVYQNPVSRPQVLLTFDDNWDGAYSEGFKYMQLKGLRGTMFTIASTVGTAGYMTEAQLAEMYAAGWDMATHSVNQHDTLATQAAIEADVAANKAYLVAQGWTGAEHIFAYPAGVMTANSYAALATAGITVARHTSDKLFAPEFGVHDLRAIPGRAANGSTSATILDYVDEAIALGKTIVLYMHDIETTPGVDDIDPTTFREVIDGLLTRRAAGSCDIPTFTEYLRGLNY